MDLNTAFLKLPLRAERGDPAVLVQTFVDVGPLFTTLSNDDHQVLYGRRGTGKTHALKYLVEEMRRRGQMAAYVDMRTIGSSGGLYGDTSLPFAERATRLLMDTLGVVHDLVVDAALGDTPISKQIGSEILPRLDALADAISEVRVTGTVERQRSESESTTDHSSASMKLGLPLSAGVEGAYASEGARKTEVRTTETGRETHRVHFGSAAKYLAAIVESLPNRRLWLLLDEWSVVPLDLQPLLADFLRRCVLPVPGVTVKIGAIEHRSRFRVPSGTGDYIGLEIGADTSANLELDDFMVFNNDAEKAKAFFGQLLLGHVQSVFAAESEVHSALGSPDMLVAAAFTQASAFDEVVRAAEGVPRDFVNILGLAAQKAGEARISIPHVRAAARQWYQRDKLASASANVDASTLLVWIMEDVIGTRHARAFLLEQGKSHPLIDALYDSRVLHVVRRGVSAQDVPGVRFTAYGLDYGCYVELMATKKGPRGLFPVSDDRGEEVYPDVPQDDYRSIRRAILDVAAFERRLQIARSAG